MIRNTLPPFTIGALTLGGCAASSNGEGPIDREALVARHNPVLTKVDPHAPLMVGNGDTASLPTSPGCRLSRISTPIWRLCPDPAQPAEAAASMALWMARVSTVVPSQSAP